MKRDLNIIQKRKKLWDLFGWGYKDQPNRLFKNKHLTDNCSKCRWERFLKRYKKKAKRRGFKSTFKKEISYD